MFKYLIFISLLFLLIKTNSVVVELNDTNFDKEMTDDNWLIYFFNNDCSFFDSLLKWNEEKKLGIKIGKIDVANETDLINSLNINNLTAPFWIYAKKWEENFLLSGESNLEEVKNFVENDHTNHSIPLIYELDEEKEENEDEEEDKGENKGKNEEENEPKEDNKNDSENDSQNSEKKDSKNLKKDSRDNKKSSQEKKESEDKKKDSVKKTETPAPSEKINLKKREYKEVDKREKKEKEKEKEVVNEDSLNNNSTNTTETDNKDNNESDDEEDKDEDESDDNKNSDDEKEEEFKWPVDPDTIVLTSNNFERKTASGVWFIDFYAPWCPHCQELASVWGKLATRAKREMKGKVNIAKVDVDKHESISSKYKVEFLPSLILLKDGMIYTYEGDHNERDLWDFIKGGYKKAKATKSSNEFVGRAADDSSQPKKPSPPPEDNSFFNSICGKSCRRIVLDLRFVTLILVVLISVFVFLIFYKPSDKHSFVKKNRRKKKN